MALGAVVEWPQGLIAQPVGFVVDMPGVGSGRVPARELTATTSLPALSDAGAGAGHTCCIDVVYTTITVVGETLFMGSAHTTGAV
jgi:hypothetical protein